MSPHKHENVSTGAPLTWAFVVGAGEGNRTPTVTLGIRPIGASDRPDLGTRRTVSDRDGPDDIPANGP
jgi:hypothetical protein